MNTFISPEFPRNDCLDVLLYSGFEVDLAVHPALKNYTKESLAWKAAFTSLDESYKKYKENLQKTLTCNQFLQRIEKSISQLESAENRDSSRLSVVASKLKEVAKSRLSEEKKFSWIYKLFHKIGQLFKGRGFRTEGQWAEVLASRLEKRHTDLYKDQVALWLLQGHRFEEVDRNSLMEQVNKLSSQAFGDLLENSVFKISDSWKSLTSGNKNSFYNLLEEEKQEQFLQCLLKREDWFQQWRDMADVTLEWRGDQVSHTLQIPFSEKLVDRVASNTALFLKASSILNMEVQADRYCTQLLLSHVLKRFIDSKNVIELNNFISKCFESTTLRPLLEPVISKTVSMEVLTDTHIEFLNSNFNFEALRRAYF